MMNAHEAREALLLHSFSYPDLTHPKMVQGFLGSLRPYTGLRDENFREVMEAIRVLAPEFRTQDAVDKELISALWDICFQTWSIALQSEGALRRNELITQEEIEKLEGWLFDIFFSVSILLQGGDLSAAFSSYQGGTRE
jgi:hypothetical protein